MAIIKKVVICDYCKKMISNKKCYICKCDVCSSCCYYVMMTSYGGLRLEFYSASELERQNELILKQANAINIIDNKIFFCYKCRGVFENMKFKNDDNDIMKKIIDLLYQKVLIDKI